MKLVKAWAWAVDDLQGTIHAAEHGIHVPLFDSEVDAMDWLDRKRRDPYHAISASNWKVKPVEIRELKPKRKVKR